MYSDKKQSLEKIIEKFTPSVQREAHKIHRGLPPSVDVKDLIQAGFMGLIEAHKTYKPVGSVPFEGYALKKIKWSIYDELRSQDWISSSVRSKMNKIQSAISQASQKSEDGKPSEEEIALEMEMSADEYRNMYSSLSCMQFTERVDFDQEIDIEDEDATSPADAVLKTQHREILIKAIKSLPEREALLLSLYYEEDLTYREIAEILEVSIPRINQLHIQALSRIKTHFAS